MGCCISTNSCSETATNPKANKQISFNDSRISKSPPQPEEETVKEIVHLSQPQSLSQKQENLSAEIVTSSPFIKSAPLLLEKPLIIKAPPRFPKNTDRNGVASTKKKPFATHAPNDDVSEEISSTVSEAVSEKREESSSSSKPGREALVKGRQRTMSKSPGRRTDPYPNRFRPSPGRGRDNSTSRELVSDRRSKSPVTRVDSNRALKANTGRSNPPRRTIRSPNRSGSGLSRAQPESVPGDESLENPLVSMECFIFL